jgi:hypothetical protein
LNRVLTLKFGKYFGYSAIYVIINKWLIFKIAEKYRVINTGFLGFLCLKIVKIIL